MATTWTHYQEDRLVKLERRQERLSQRLVELTRPLDVTGTELAPVRSVVGTAPGAGAGQFIGSGPATADATAAKETLESVQPRGHSVSLPPLAGGQGPPASGLGLWTPGVQVRHGGIGKGGESRTHVMRQLQHMSQTTQNLRNALLKVETIIGLFAQLTHTLQDSRSALSAAHGHTHSHANPNLGAAMLAGLSGLTGGGALAGLGGMPAAGAVAAPAGVPSAAGFAAGGGATAGTPDAGGAGMAAALAGLGALLPGAGGPGAAAAGDPGMAAAGGMMAPAAAVTHGGDGGSAGSFNSELQKLQALMPLLQQLGATRSGLPAKLAAVVSSPVFQQLLTTLKT